MNYNWVMAIFSRRILQRMIKENCSFLSEGQIKKHVDGLNAMPRTLKLADEWEVVLLNAFAKLGKVGHEDGKIAGTCDLYFESHEDSAKNFLADITTVSDYGFRKFGAFEELEREVARRLEKAGLNPNHFHLDVQGNHSQIQRGRLYMKRGESKPSYTGAVKAELLMPPPSEFEEKIFNADWQRFLAGIGKGGPTEYRVYKPADEINLTIALTSGRTSSHLAYKQINHLTSNALYRALVSKASQLVKANFCGPTGILVCDGGYRPFHSAPHFSTHTVKDVISHFLRTHVAVEFVATVIVNPDSLSRSSKQIGDQVYFSDATPTEVIDVIHEAVALIPQSECDAFNAVNHLKSGDAQEGRRNGELTMSSRELRISSRTLMDLLSGRLTQEDFVSRYEQSPHVARADDYTNFFDMKLKRGMMISDIRIVKSETEDDDVIVINWDGPDPAISQFQIPS